MTQLELVRVVHADDYTTMAIKHRTRQILETFRKEHGLQMCSLDVLFRAMTEFFIEHPELIKAVEFTPNINDSPEKKKRGSTRYKKVVVEATSPEEVSKAIQELSDENSEEFDEPPEDEI